MKNYFTGDWYSDLCMLECIVMNLEFYSGSERKYKCEGRHTKNMGSMLYGITWRQRASYQKQRELDSESGMYKTKIYEEEPELKAIFKEFSQLYFPEFDYLQIQMNKNFKILPHFDSKNAGISKLISFGDYVGGNTRVAYDDNKMVDYDSRDCVVSFDGSKYKHWVQPFSGTRYSLVFFSNSYLLKRIAKRNALLV
tara:strand:- start:2657 stop:3244 length:588 start_codon:yes stop_codon:yes gene_type:complete